MSLLDQPGCLQLWEHHSGGSLKPGTEVTALLANLGAEARSHQPWESKDVLVCIRWKIIESIFYRKNWHLTFPGFFKWRRGNSNAESNGSLRQVMIQKSVGMMVKSRMIRSCDGRASRAETSTVQISYRWFSAVGWGEHIGSNAHDKELSKSLESWFHRLMASKMLATNDTCFGCTFLLDPYLGTCSRNFAAYRSASKLEHPEMVWVKSLCLSKVVDFSWFLVKAKLKARSDPLGSKIKSNTSSTQPQGGWTCETSSSQGAQVREVIQSEVGPEAIEVIQIEVGPQALEIIQSEVGPQALEVIRSEIGPQALEVIRSKESKTSRLLRLDLKF
nr:hypothetical protein Iba_chr07cCG9550 [Ipomoea batatas]